jgi:hypothetical protein
MKKLILVIAIITSGFSTFALSTNPTQNETPTVFITEGFEEIAIENLPNAVIEALAKNYTAAKISKAYVNSKEQYKLEIYMQPTDNIVFADKDGNWLKRKDLETTQSLKSSI